MRRRRYWPAQTLAALPGVGPDRSRGQISRELPPSVPRYRYGIVWLNPFPRRMDTKREVGREILSLGLVSVLVSVTKRGRSGGL